MTHEGPIIVAARIRSELADLDQVLSRATNAAVAIGDPALAAFAIDSAALNVHDLYVGMERLFETIADNIDRSVPDGGRWHRDLLQQMSLPLKDRRQRVLPPELRDELVRLLGFRHVVRNVYAYQLRADDVVANVRLAEDLFPRVRKELEAFAGWLESLSPDA